MQYNYGAAYQQQPGATYPQPEGMRIEYGYGVPSTSAQSLDTPAYNTAPYTTYQSYTPAESISSSSSGLLSPTSHRSSVSATTPLTPYSYGPSSGYIKDGQQQQDSWFGAMQDNYLAARPGLQRMQRMSISSELQPQSSSSRNGFLSVQADTAPRRASVVTFQPTASRPSSTPRRPSMQPISRSDTSLPITSPHTASLSPYHEYSGSPLKHPHLSLDIPKAPLPTIYAVPTPSIEVDNTEVDRLFAEVFGGQQSAPLSASPMQLASSAFSITSPTSMPFSPMQEPSNYNFSGVLLQPEDLHMLGPDPLSAALDQTYSTTSYSSLAKQQTQQQQQQQQQQQHQQRTPRQQQSGWNTEFTLGAPITLSHSQSQFAQTAPRPMLELSATTSTSAQWNFSSFHGFQPITSPRLAATSAPFERSNSAPPANEPEVVMGSVQPAEGFTMDRRRGSSVDSPALLPFGGQGGQLGSPAASAQYHPASEYYLGPTSPTSPQTPVVARRSSAYLGPGPHYKTSPPSALALRRATIGPQPLSLTPPRPSYRPYPAASPSSPSAPGTPSARRSPMASPILSPKSPSKRLGVRAGSGSGRRASASPAPMFINFTSKDANKLLSGVAPSGSSKRKREEEEQARAAKLVRDELEMESSPSQ